MPDHVPFQGKISVSDLTNEILENATPTIALTLAFTT